MNDQILDVLGKRYDEKLLADSDGSLGQELDAKGILVLPDFVSGTALAALQKEAEELKKNEYRSESAYNLYVLPEDKSFAADSPRNRQFRTTKGIIADDQIPADSVLRKIYDSDLFRKFVCRLQKIDTIYSYVDPLSSINYNYYDPGDSLEWHFDNADFAITLLVKKCDRGGEYEYLPNIRYAANGKEDYETLRKVLDGEIKAKTEPMDAGALMIFRGNRSLHRVTKIEAGERVLVTLNYNLEPGIPLSEESRKTFFGRIN